MSTQRRRVLEDTKIHDGVYIEGLDGKAYTVDNWQGGSAANSVIVASGDVKFRIALTESPSPLAVYNNFDTIYDEYMTWHTSSATALSDYDGAGNTAKMLIVDDRYYYAAGYCDTYIFPDGKTKGYLPALGQLYIAHQNKAAVDAALSKCGGTAMNNTEPFNYWSSTYKEDDNDTFWTLTWMREYEYFFGSASLVYEYYVRPFADLT